LKCLNMRYAAKKSMIPVNGVFSHATWKIIIYIYGFVGSNYGGHG